MNYLCQHRNRIYFAFIIFISLGLTSCAGGLPRYWPEKTGRVLEYGTNKPLENVIVLARWQGVGGVAGPQDVCYQVETATTNSSGEFTLPGYNDGIGDSLLASRHISLSFYHSGYKTNRLRPGGKYYQTNDYYLDPFNGTTKERFEYFTIMVRSSICSESGISRRNAFVYYKILYEEAKLLAKTKEEKNDVKWIREIMAASLDENIVTLTGGELEERIEQVLREHEK